jgi:hypothetical protein
MIVDSFMNSFWLFVLVELAAGVVMGILSSSIAIRKYLKI